MRVPETFFSLVLFGLILIPGVVYRHVRRGKFPTRRIEGSQETIRLISVGLVSFLAGLLVLLTIRWITPSHSPDSTSFISDTKNYIAEHTFYVFLWFTGTLALVTAGAWFAAKKLPQPKSSEISDDPAWWKVFEGEYRAEDDSSEEIEVYVNCHLTDGSVLSGWLLSYSPDSEETLDRDLSLVEPIEYRPSGSYRSETMEDAVAVISATRIKFVLASYYPVENEADDDNDKDPVHTGCV